jgi:polysaccharide export outer membrane protein
MNLLSKLALFPCAALLVGVVLSGCRSVEQPIFSDNPTVPTMSAPASATLTNDVPSVGASGAIFQLGETVIVASSTGSETDPGPIAATGQNYLVDDDGTITLPLIGKVQVAGKAQGELQDAIEKLYVPEYYIRLTVTITSENRVYYVGGEVAHPGAEPYLGETTVSKAVQAAGDLTQFASHKVYLTRKDGTRIKVNVDKALRDTTQDPPVYPGDQIQVPRRYF